MSPNMDWYPIQDIFPVMIHCNPDQVAVTVRNTHIHNSSFVTPLTDIWLNIQIHTIVNDIFVSPDAPY